MRHTTIALTVLAGVALVASMATAQTPAAPEVLKATGTVTGSGGAVLTAPVTITIKRVMSQFEADKYVTAFKRGGEAGLRNALIDIPTTGTIQLGGAKPVVTRLTTERKTEKGRQLTIITLEPLLFLGASLPGAQQTKGYNFGIIHLEFDATGAGSGTIVPAGWVKLDDQGSFVVKDYSGEMIKLTVGAK